MEVNSNCGTFKIETECSNIRPAQLFQDPCLNMEIEVNRIETGTLRVLVNNLWTHSVTGFPKVAANYCHCLDFYSRFCHIARVDFSNLVRLFWNNVKQILWTTIFYHNSHDVSSTMWRSLS